MRQGDAGVGERLLLGGGDAGGVAEGGDLDGPADAGAPQRRGDARAEAARVDAAGEAAPLQVPPHRHLHRPGLRPIVLLPLAILLLLLQLAVVAPRGGAVAGRGGGEGSQAAGEDAAAGGLDAEEEADAAGEHGGGGRSPWRRGGCGGFRMVGRVKTLVGWAWAMHVGSAQPE